VDRRHLRKVLDQLSVIQIDSVNVLVRSQELPLFARLGDHPRSLITDATNDGEMFEYWCHAASHMPIDMYPLVKWRMEMARKGENVWQTLQDLAKKKPAFINEVRDRVFEADGLVAGEFKTRKGPKGQWWDWDEGKQALEYLFWTGEITARRRSEDFARVYHAPHKVLPADVVNAPVLSSLEARRQLFIRAAQAMGVATGKDLLDYHRQRGPEASKALKSLVESGDLEEVRVEGWKDKAYMVPGTKVPRTVSSRALLSPFDNLIWFRPRNERLFDFHYRLEIYTPEPQRIYGYYVLPFLLDDRVVARVDLKADRHAGELLVPGAFSEEDVDVKYVAQQLRDELTLMAKWLGLHTVRVGTNGDLSDLLVKSGTSRSRTWPSE